MPNAVAMTKSVRAGMNLRPSTETTIRGSAGAGQDGHAQGTPFITANWLFITANDVSTHRGTEAPRNNFDKMTSVSLCVVISDSILHCSLQA